MPVLIVIVLTHTIVGVLTLNEKVDDTSMYAQEKWQRQRKNDEFNICEDNIKAKGKGTR